MAAVLIAILVSFSRLYLGVHWWTDVVGGMALGGLWLCTLGAMIVFRGPSGPLTIGIGKQSPDGYTFTDGDYFGLAVGSTGIAHVIWGEADGSSLSAAATSGTRRDPDRRGFHSMSSAARPRSQGRRGVLLAAPAGQRLGLASRGQTVL